jgi:hypothetical protein
LRYRRDRRFAAAACAWRDIVALTEPAAARRKKGMSQLRQFAAESLAIHHEHRERDLHAARELALFALHEDPPPRARADGLRHRLARLDRKIARNRNAELFF